MYLLTFKDISGLWDNSKNIKEHIKGELYVTKKGFIKKWNERHEKLPNHMMQKPDHVIIRENSIFIQKVN